MSTPMSMSVESSEKAKHPDQQTMDHKSGEQYNGEPQTPEADSAPVEVINYSNTMTRVRRWIKAIGAEESGIERIPEGSRTNQRPWTLFVIFFSANCTTATLALGYLGPAVFNLGWWDSFLCILFFNLLGAVPPALLVQFGHRMGLRTMTVPRYSFGWWPAKAIGIINVITQIGWAIVNDLSGADILYDVGGGDLPSAVCVILIGVVAIIIALFGYNYIHAFERYSWMAVVVCLTILAGFGAPHFVNVPMGRGSLEIASVLSFGTVIMGYELAWVLIAADYSVYMKETTNNTSVVGCAYGGFFISQFLIEILGAAFGTLIMSSDERFGRAYEAAGMGGLIGETFAGHGAGVRGLGKFVEAVLAFSIAAVLVVGMYSIGLSAQVVSKKALLIPRFVYTLIGGAVFLVCSVAGRDHLEAVMTNFLNICAYYVTPFTTIVLADCYIWRRGFKYDLEAWNDGSRLPLGVAASVSFVLGTLVALLCMSQAWWVGPIAAAIGGSPTGMDISWILAAVVSIVVYVPARHFEFYRSGH
ncbi:purine-cytosine permease [Fusarium solani]|uniref:Purine-cytosine permease n=1 Tax=Fusarium solani TaxID=169388 RepID=A0A9P9GU91_FUSSL|nr:purine-cytosine permease [Fusarium solani]KAH7244877.1 purine-cytosine permease [Fusarium solani]